MLASLPSILPGSPFQTVPVGCSSLLTDSQFARLLLDQGVQRNGGGGGLSYPSWSPFFLFSCSPFQAVLDGYSAPLTAGNFARLVSKREYDGVAVKTTSQAVLSDARNAAKLASETPEMPLELKPSGEFQPVYRTALDVAVRPLPLGTRSFLVQC